jgi:regulator of sigma E protease
LPFVLDSLETFLAIVVVFGLLVFVHELGHFLLARRAGILCREFALGMGPKIFRIKRGETEYTLRLLPIGGLVRMAGEDPEMDMLKPHMEIAVELDPVGKVKRFLLDGAGSGKPHVLSGTIVRYDVEHQLTLTLDIAGEQRTLAVHPQALLVKGEQEVQIAPYNRQFKGKTISQRFWTIFAGPAANFFLAFVLLALIGFMYGVPTNEAKIGKVLAGGPAAQAGLLEGDRVISIEGNRISNWQEIVQKISASPDKTLLFVIERGGEQKSVPVKVRGEKYIEKVNGKEMERRVGKIMVSSPVTYSKWEAMKYGASSTYEFTVMMLTGLVQLFTGQVGLDQLSGPAGILIMTGEIAQQGLIKLMTWAAVLSINLGLFNLLPLPALDGGRLAFLFVEALRGRPVDPHKEGMVHFLGFAFLMLLILVVTWKDLQRFIFQ